MKQQTLIIDNINPVISCKEYRIQSHYVTSRARKDNDDQFEYPYSCYQKRTPVTKDEKFHLLLQVYK